MILSGDAFYWMVGLVVRWLVGWFVGYIMAIRHCSRMRVAMVTTSPFSAMSWLELIEGWPLLLLGRLRIWPMKLSIMDRRQRVKSTNGSLLLLHTSMRAACDN